MQLKKIISFIAGLLGAMHLLAQTGNPGTIYYHIGEKDGLTDNLVTCFYQDSRNMMWMGTAYGLNSFDGSVIKTWRKEDGLPDMAVSGIAADGHHRLWLATQNGLAMLDPAEKRIRSWRSAGDNFMNALVCDGDSVWIATLDGLLAFDTRQKTFRYFKNEADKKNDFLFAGDNHLYSLLLDHKKRLWLASSNGLWLFDRARRTFTAYDSNDNDPFFDPTLTTVFEGHDGKIWVGGFDRA